MSDRGRPRDPAADVAIEAAVRGLLAEVGYRKTSIEQVAHRAGVSKSTVYRRARDKADLVFAVMFGSEPPPPGHVGPDWEAVLKELIAALSVEFMDPVARVAMPGLFSEFSCRPELAERVRRDLLAPAYVAVEGLLDEVRGRGVLRDDVDTELWCDMLFGAVFVRSLLFDRPVDKAVTDHMVDTALAGIRAPAER